MSDPRAPTLFLWQKNGTILSPLTSGDSVTTSGNINIDSNGYTTELDLEARRA